MSNLIIVKLVIAARDRIGNIKIALVDYGDCVGIPNSIHCLDTGVSAEQLSYDLFSDITGIDPTWAVIRPINFFEDQDCIDLVYLCMLPEVINIQCDYANWYSIEDVIDRILSQNLQILRYVSYVC